MPLPPSGRVSFASSRAMRAHARALKGKRAARVEQRAARPPSQTSCGVVHSNSVRMRWRVPSCRMVAMTVRAVASLAARSASRYAVWAASRAMFARAASFARAACSRSGFGRSFSSRASSARCLEPCRDCWEIASCQMRVLLDFAAGGTQSVALADLVAAIDFTPQSNTFNCLIEEL